MKLKLNNYIREIEEKINSKKIESNLKEDLLIKITFFQHERFVHLIVTFFTGICAILFLLGFLYFEILSLLILHLITIILFIPYIFHYYYLENGVQKLYDLYETINKKIK